MKNYSRFIVGLSITLLITSSLAGCFQINETMNTGTRENTKTSTTLYISEETTKNNVTTVEETRETPTNTVESTTVKTTSKTSRATTSTTTVAPTTTVPTPTTTVTPSTPSSSASNAPVVNNGMYNTAYVRSKMFNGGRVQEGRKVAFLTYDDGLNIHSTPLLLDALLRARVHATFYILGNSINDSTAYLLRRMVHEGHAIGIHSFNHNYNALYPGRSGNVNEILNQFDRSLTAIRKYLGADFQVTTWRYPGGHMSWRGLGPANERLRNIYGVEYIDWNALNDDASGTWYPANPEQQVAQLKKSLAAYGNPPTAVVLMHDGTNRARQITMQSVSSIVSYLRSNGYEFGTLK